MAGLVKGLPLVSICIPAYRSQTFIRQTIESALDQTVDDIEIIVSNDGGLAMKDLDQYRSHQKVRVIEQQTRLGWVRNTNAVVAEARGAHFMILPHDDVLRPQYVESCLGLLRDDPEVFAAYSDIETDTGVMEATEVIGSVFDRITKVMCDLYNGYSFRAVMRRHPDQLQQLQLQPNPPTDFCADTTWMLQQASFGALRKVDKPLYWKRFHSQSTHASWEALPPRKMLGAWRKHCVQMGDIASYWIDDNAYITDLVAHRKDPRRVHEAPHYLKTAIAAEDGKLRWRLERFIKP
jgi:glycosyltransferase involved in cell wall biosynthesis